MLCLLLSITATNKSKLFTVMLLSPVYRKSKIRPYGRDVLKYGGSYYTLSAQRIPYQKDKTTDERFFILSLFAIAEEIEHRALIPPG